MVGSRSSEIIPPGRPGRHAGKLAFLVGSPGELRDPLSADSDSRHAANARRVGDGLGQRRYGAWGALARVRDRRQNAFRRAAEQLSAAAKIDPNSATAQFFINLVDNTQLGASGFTVFGQVLDMSTVDVIASLPKDRKVVLYSNGGEQSAKAATLVGT